MLKNLRRSYWLISIFLKKHLAKIALVAFFTITILLITPPLIQRLPTGKPSLKIGRVGQFTVSQLPLDIQRLISNGLTNIAPDGSATPSLALNWQIADNGHRYVFQLDPSKTWHDGRSFQAADISYSFEDIELNLIDSQTLEFKLKEPFAPFPTAVSLPLFRRAKIISKIFKRSQSALVGTGEYHVNKVEQHGQFINTLWLESKQEKRIYKFYTTEEAAILGFKLGEVNALHNLTSVKELENWKNIIINQTLHPDRYVAVFFNTKDSYLSDKNLRQALTYAIPDKPEGDQRALGPIHPYSWAYNPQVKTYASNQLRAQQLIDEIKQTDNGFAPVIRLDTTLGYLDLAEKIKTAWENLGIITEIKVINFPAQDYQALLAVYQIPPDPDQYTLWHSTQSTNITQLQSPKIDKLLEDGRKILDQKERKQIYQDFQRFLLEECPAAFLFYQTTYDTSRKILSR